MPICDMLKHCKFLILNQNFATRFRNGIATLRVSVTPACIFVLPCFVPGPSIYQKTLNFPWFRWRHMAAQIGVYNPNLRQQPSTAKNVSLMFWHVLNERVDCSPSRWSENNLSATANYDGGHAIYIRQRHHEYGLKLMKITTSLNFTPEARSPFGQFFTRTIRWATWLVRDNICQVYGCHQSHLVYTGSREKISC